MQDDLQGRCPDRGRCPARGRDAVTNRMPGSQGGVHCEGFLEVGQQGIERGRRPGRRP
jgi:hypothetical protein